MAWTCNSDGEKLHIYTYIYICIYNICTYIYIYTHTHTHRIPSRRMSVAAVILTWIFEKPRTPNRGFEQTNSLSKFNDRCPPPHTHLYCTALITYLALLAELGQRHGNAAGPYSYRGSHLPALRVLLVRQRDHRTGKSSYPHRDNWLTLGLFNDMVNSYIYIDIKKEKEVKMNPSTSP